MWLQEPKDPADKLVTVTVILTGLLGKDGVFLVTTRQTITGPLPGLDPRSFENRVLCVWYRF